MDVEHHGGDEDDNVGGFHGRRGLPPRASIPSSEYQKQTHTHWHTQPVSLLLRSDYYFKKS